MLKDEDELIQEKEEALKEAQYLSFYHCIENMISTPKEVTFLINNRLKDKTIIFSFFNEEEIEEYFSYSHFNDFLFTVSMLNFYFYGISKDYKNAEEFYLKPKEENLGLFFQAFLSDQSHSYQINKETLKDQLKFFKHISSVEELKKLYLDIEYNDFLDIKSLTKVSWKNKEILKKIVPFAIFEKDYRDFDSNIYESNLNTNFIIGIASSLLLKNEVISKKIEKGIEDFSFDFQSHSIKRGPKIETKWILRFLFFKLGVEESFIFLKELINTDLSISKIMDYLLYLEDTKDVIPFKLWVLL